MKIVVFSILLLAAIASESLAQVLPDNFASRAECEAMVAAGKAAPYYPSITSNRPLLDDEVILPNPIGGCFLMEVPDRIGRWRYVYTEPGRDYVWRRPTSGSPAVETLPLRLAQCDNLIKDGPLASPFRITPPPITVDAPAPRTDDRELGRLRDELARQRSEIDLLRNQEEPLQNEVRFDVDTDDGMPGWLKAVITGAAIAGGGYLIYKCVTDWCEDENNNVNVINAGPSGVVVTQGLTAPAATFRLKF